MSLCSCTQGAAPRRLAESAGLLPEAVDPPLPQGRLPGPGPAGLCVGTAGTALHRASGGVTECPLTASSHNAPFEPQQVLFKEEKKLKGSKTSVQTVVIVVTSFHLNLFLLIQPSAITHQLHLESNREKQRLDPDSYLPEQPDKNVRIPSHSVAEVDSGLCLYVAGVIKKLTTRW